MSITETAQKIKNFFRESGSREKFLTIAIICLVGTASFGLGRISALENGREPVKIENLPLEANVSTSLNREVETEEKEVSEGVILKAGGMVVASKNGGKYHFPWCSGAQRILEENKLYFASIEEARAEGYTPAANCKGLE